MQKTCESKTKQEWRQSSFGLMRVEVGVQAGITLLFITLVSTGVALSFMSHTVFRFPVMPYDEPVAFAVVSFPFLSVLLAFLVRNLSRWICLFKVFTVLASSYRLRGRYATSDLQERVRPAELKVHIRAPQPSSIFFFFVSITFRLPEEVLCVCSFTGRWLDLIVCVCNGGTRGYFKKIYTI